MDLCGFTWVCVGLSIAKAHISVRNALNLSGGGWFDKLDPYAIVRPPPNRPVKKTSKANDF